MKLLNLVKLLQLTPTGDNCQPFKYEIEENSILVKHDYEQAKHVFNQSNIASLLSAGFQIEVVRRFCLDNDLQYSVNLDELEAENFSFTIVLIGNLKEETFSIELENLLKLRATDRRAYSKVALTSFFSKYDSKKNISLKNNLSKTFMKMIYKTELYMFNDINAFRNIEDFVRYNKTEKLKSKTGFSYQNLLMDPFMALMFKMFSKGSFFNVVLKKYFYLLVYLRVNVFYKASSGFVSFSLEEGKVSNREIVNKAMDIFNFWLDLTEQGFVAQPISSASMLPFIQYSQRGKFTNEFENVFSTCFKNLKAEFNQEEEIPFWVMRYGKRKSMLPRKLRTLRKNVEDVVNIKDEESTELQNSDESVELRVS